MFTDFQKQIIIGLSKIERKKYNTQILAAIIRDLYRKDLKDIDQIKLEQEISKLLYIH